MDKMQFRNYRDDRPFWIQRDRWYSTGTPAKARAEYEAVAEVQHALSCPMNEPELLRTVSIDPDDPWVLLANAIIYRAAMDYMAYVMYLMDWNSKEIRKQRDNCLAFFHSKMFGQLTTLDPDELVQALDERAETFLL